MKKLLYSITFVLLAGLLGGCTQHFIGDREYRIRVRHDFEAKRDSMRCPELFAIFDTDLDCCEREALQFLYAYMPLADIADYDGEFHLANVQAAFRARQEMPWGKDVPDELFRHFVLPVRVNNEPLDSARTVFYRELKSRVETLSIADAILEVNHWCHEKAIYTPSDARTSSPLATVRTAYGRCGEESTLLVAALRSVGIPARQVYTPRWAHTDDNHAWVEAWADGEWHFLGACEPEPVLDLGWFNAPASRGMLMNTKVFGRYNGPEEILQVKPNYTEINVTSNYAPVAKTTVTVVDVDGKVVSDALVEFKLYNYAEFFTLASKRSDAEGHCSLTTGLGDILVWAADGNRFGFAKVSVREDNETVVKLDKAVGDEFQIDLDIVPPVENAKLPEVTPEQRAENDRRMAIEDSIRNAYTSKFPTSDELLVASRGNFATIRDFLASMGSNQAESDARNLLDNLSDKDLRDVTMDVLLDHVVPTPADASPLFGRYVRSPRVANEQLTPFRAFFANSITPADSAIFAKGASAVVKWVADSIRIAPECNLGACPITPIGVWKVRMADVHSRDIFFVALARYLGIPSRIDEVTGKVQLMTDGVPVDVDFGSEQPKAAPQGTIKASYSPSKILDDPKYYYHFSISKLTDKGNLRLLEYDEEGKDAWSNMLRDGSQLDAGQYLMVSGTRLANGGVLAHLNSFVIKPDQTTETELVMRQSTDQVQVIGSFNSESLFTTLDGTRQSLLQACGRGYFVVGILGVGQEPTNHALRDIAAVRAALEAWGRPMVLLFPDQANANKFAAAPIAGLPTTISYGLDTDGIATQIAEEMKLRDSTSLPIFIIADTFNRVVFVSQGYTIGLGEQLVKTAKGL